MDLTLKGHFMSLKLLAQAKTEIKAMSINNFSNNWANFYPPSNRHQMRLCLIQFLIGERKEIVSRCGDWDICFP